MLVNGIYFPSPKVFQSPFYFCLMKKLIDGLLTKLFGPVEEQDGVKEKNGGLEIEYLKNVKAFMDKQKWSQANHGVNESKINELEDKLGKKFPKAYREFLWLAGKEFSPFKESHELDYIIENKINETAPEVFKKHGIKLPKNDYWIFAEENAVMSFFYFDEGDNPPVYRCEYEYNDGVHDYLRKTHNTLTEFMQHWIDYYNPRIFEG